MDGLPAFMGNPLFSVYSLTASINRMPYLPGLIGRQNIFDPRPLTTTVALIEKRDVNRLALVPEVPRGGPANRNVMGQRGVIPFMVPHFPLADTVMADSILGVRAFGSENQLETVNEVIQTRLESMNVKHDVTLEHLRLGAIKGSVITVVNRETGAVENAIDLFAHFGIPRPETVEWPIGFTRDNLTSGDIYLAPIRQLVTDIARRMANVLGGLPYSRIVAVCGSAFFDAVASAPEMREIYLYSQAQALRDETLGTAITYANCTFIEYMGRIGMYDLIEPEMAYFYPLGVPDLFVEAYAPADYMETVNTLALRRYAKQEMMDFDRGVMIETQQNVLPLCTMPEVLLTAKVVPAPPQPQGAQASGAPLPLRHRNSHSAA